ncbi:hypothetical protein PISL3812_08485 [Talaromyces islandicus]|uniref:Uncharacterized protein n=1 Tax=Talaromyces islandicus TaxID=28573 RepID=A0A0U1M7A1_TALIS|nr:hypothetical protein PISL3812_08485 [Talaromyces islandicus]
MALHLLPAEVIGMIAEAVPFHKAHQLTGLVRVNWRLHLITTRFLYSKESIERALWYAEVRDKVDCFRKAMEQKANNSPYSEVKPPNGSLLKCCSHGSINVAKLIVQSYPEMLIGDEDGSGRDALHIAAGAGELEIVSWLLTLPEIDPSQEDHQGKTPLIYACYSGNADIINKLLSSPGVDINHSGLDTLAPLHVAYENHRVEAMRALLSDNRLNLERTSVNILDSCVCFGNSETLRLLLSVYGSQPFMRHNWAYDALQSAVLFQKYDMVKEFTKVPNFDINATKMGAFGAFTAKPILWVALLYSGAKMWRLLFKFPNLDVNSRCFDRYGTPLIYAVRKWEKGLVRMLIRRGCDLNEQDSDFGATALIWAVVKGDESVVRLILSGSGIDPSIKDRLGVPALIYAIANRRYEITELLLEHPRVDVNITSNNGLTPLILAVQNDIYDIARLLVEKGGVDYDITDNDGKTVSDYATGDSWEWLAVLIRAARQNTCKIGLNYEAMT